MVGVSVGGSWFWYDGGVGRPGRFVAGGVVVWVATLDRRCAVRSGYGGHLPFY